MRLLLVLAVVDVAQKILFSGSRFSLVAFAVFISNVHSFCKKKIIKLVPKFHAF